MALYLSISAVLTSYVAVLKRRWRRRRQRNIPPDKITYFVEYIHDHIITITKSTLSPNFRFHIAMAETDRQEHFVVVVNSIHLKFIYHFSFLVTFSTPFLLLLLILHSLQFRVLNERNEQTQHRQTRQRRICKGVSLRNGWDEKLCCILHI